jgi:hypothetical protein
MILLQIVSQDFNNLTFKGSFFESLQTKGIKKLAMFLQMTRT